MPQAIASETETQPSNTWGPGGIRCIAYLSSRWQADGAQGATP